MCAAVVGAARPPVSDAVAADDGDAEGGEGAEEQGESECLTDDKET